MEEKAPLLELELEVPDEDNQQTKYKSIDEIIELLGWLGRYQVLLSILVMFAVLFNGYQTLLLYFVASNPGWQCTHNSTNLSSFCNSNQGNIIFHASHPDFNQRCSLNRSEWKYTKHSTYSIVTEYDLVCSKSYLATLANSIFFVCGAIGSVLSGFLGDKYGRKYPACFMIVAHSVCSLASGFVNNIWLYISFRGIIGISFYSINNLAYILYMEQVIPKYRAIVTACFPISASISVALLTIIASHVQEWRKLVLYTSLPGFTVAICSLFVFQSPRWLLSRSPDKAKRVLLKMAAFNNVSLGDFELKVCNDYKNAEEERQYSYKDMFTTSPKAFLIITAQFFLWLLGYLIYFCIGYESSNLGGSIYLNLALVSLADIPGYLLIGLLYRHLGHLKLVRYSSIMVALCLIPIIVSSPQQRILNIVFASITKIFATILTTIMFSWSFEIFPTVIRAQGITICTIGVGIGSALAPVLLYYPTLVWTHLPMLLLCLLSLVNTMFTFCLPETKGKPTREKFHELTEE